MPLLKLLSLAVCAVALALVSPHGALAADMPAPVEPVVQPAPVSWTGPYVGGEIGADVATARYSRPLSTFQDISIGSVNRGVDGGIYGGFNYQVLPWLVIGVEGNLSSLSARYRELGPDLDFLMRSRYQGSVAARMGIVILPATMVYFKAGPAWIDVRGIEGFGDPFQRVRNAEMVGAGIETLVTPNVALRAEASYTRSRDWLALNDAFDLYRPTTFQVMFGAAFKLDVPGLRPLAWTGSIGRFYGAGPHDESSAAAPVAVRWTGIEVGAFGSINGNLMRFSGPFVGEDNRQGPFTDLVPGIGGFVGANYQIGSFAVVGVEGSANHQRAIFNTAAAVGLAEPLFHFASVNDILAVTARVGWLASPGTLLYVKGGPAWIRMAPDRDYWNAIGPNPGVQRRELVGYQYGAGAETFLTSNLSVKIEGLYTSTRARVTFNGIDPSTPFTLRPSLLSGTFGAALHF